MLSIVNVITPVFALVAVGYIAVRIRLYPPVGVRGLIAFVNNFATPCLLFQAMVSVDFGAAFNPSIIVAFYAGALTVFAIGIVLSRTVFANTTGAAIPSGFSATFSNTVLLGIPIIQRAFGDAALPTIYSIIGVHAPLLMSLGMLAMEFTGRGNEPAGELVGKIAKRIFTNPLLLGIIAGLLVNVSGIGLNEPVSAFVEMMAQAVLPCALFGLGGALNEYRIRENWGQALTMSGFKLIVHPAIAWIVMVPVLHVDHDIARYAVILAAMPTGINAYIFATLYNRSTDVAANTVLIATALSVVTISGWLYFMSI